MKELNEQHEIFQKHLREFERILAKYGYIYLHSEYKDHPNLPMESMHYVYRQKQSGNDLSFKFIVGNIQNRTIQLGFSIYMPDKKYFSLNHFFENHKNLKEIKTLFSDHCDFEVEVRSYFLELKNAFETYLNDQISGRSFEDHSVVVLNEYHQSSAPYEMQKQVVNEAVKAREKPSVWSRFKKLFK